VELCVWWQVLCPAGARIATPSMYVVQSGSVRLVQYDTPPVEQPVAWPHAASPSTSASQADAAADARLDVDEDGREVRLSVWGPARWQ
jgi:hypothetical protein